MFFKIHPKMRAIAGKPQKSAIMYFHLLAGKVLNSKFYFNTL